MSEAPRADAPASSAPPTQSLWLLVVAWIASRGFLLFSFEPQISDVPFYWQNSERAHSHAEVPYAPGFEIGYPPLAWALMYAPRWIDPSPWDPESEHLLLGRYTRRFRAEMLLFDAAALALLVLLLWRDAPTRGMAAGWCYVLLGLVMGHLLLDRLDVALLAVLLGWACCHDRAAASEPSADHSDSGWRQLAFLLLGFSVALKLLPIVALPALILAEWRASGRLGRAASSLGYWAVGALLPFLWHVPRTGLGTFGFLAHHAGRGLQVESLYASLLYCLEPFGWQVRIERSANAWHVVGQGTALAHRLAIAVAIGWGLAWAAVVLRSVGRRGLRWAAQAAAVCIAGLPIVSHVLSPQYLLWSLVLLIWPAATHLRKRPYHTFLAVVIIAAGLTTWLFPYRYFSAAALEPTGAPAIGAPAPERWGLVPTMDWQACLLLVARNLLLVGLLAVGTFIVCRDRPTRRGPANAAAC